MRLDDRITIERLQQTNEDEPPRSQILVDGVPTGKLVAGAVLEGAVQWGSFRVLFTTDDVPFEDQLTIVLLDRDLRELDSARIGAPYATGTFSELTLIEPDTIRFRFIGDTLWTVRLLSRPQLRVPFVSEPPGVHRRFGFSRHFVVSGNPKPERS
ncbi:MAG: hypothetical protein DIU78_000880 [Pseudomonadota bacterium]|nr:MAG: hypothetical protein DIU78_12545 [Pseudomonadota bacterium]